MLEPFHTGERGPGSVHGEHRGRDRRNEVEEKKPVPQIVHGYPESDGRAGFWVGALPTGSNMEDLVPLKAADSGLSL